jgi:hypothetical protein
MTSNNSSVFNHIEENSSHVIDWDNLKIYTAKDNWRLLLKEMLQINKIKPELNVQKSLKLFSLVIGNKFGEVIFDSFKK